MRFLFLILTICSSSAWAQSFLKDVSKIHYLLSQEELDHLKEKHPNGIFSGAIFLPLIKNQEKDIFECEEEKKIEPETRYEILFIGQGSLYPNLNTSVKETIDLNEQPLIGPVGFREIFTAPKDYEFLNSVRGKNYRPVEVGQDYATSSIIRTAQDAFHNRQEATDPKKRESFRVNSELGREVMVATIIQMGAQSEKSDTELAREIGQGLAGIYKTDEEKLNFLQAMMKRLYYAYNDSRNPLSNDAENNPDKKPIPYGDMSMQNVFQAVIADNEFDNGVCNDVAEMAAMIAESMFAGESKDVLVVNSGSHFNLTVTDGKKTTVIDGMSQIQVNNDQMVTRGRADTLLHINKVVDGKLKEIATMDTQLGQVSEAVFRTGKKLLKTSTDVNALVGEIKKINWRNEKNFDEYSVTTGYAQTNHAHVVMVVAKVTSERGPLSSYIGAGVGGEISTDRSVRSNVFVDVKGGSKITLFSYMNPNINFRIATGLDGSFNSSFHDRFSWNVDWLNQINFTAKQNGPKAGYVAAEVESRHSLGSNNWGELTGANSTKFDVMRSLGGMNFYLNSVSASVLAAKPLTDSLKIQASASYLGSNVGQSVSALAGIEIKAPEGVEILVFSGYENDKIAGYQTHNGLLFGVQGATVGAQVKSKEGIKINTRVRGIGSEIMQGNVGLEVPLEIRPRGRE